jgi:hypothetical protein
MPALRDFPVLTIIRSALVNEKLQKVPFFAEAALHRAKLPNAALMPATPPEEMPVGSQIVAHTLAIRR